MEHEQIAFEGRFRVERKFMNGLVIAQPGSIITISDAFLARDLLAAGRVSCDQATADRMDAATSAPPPAAPDLHLVVAGGITRRVPKMGLI